MRVFMNRSIRFPSPAVLRSRDGFSLIEVVLAIGIFLVTVLALVGLLGPTLQSVDEVEDTDEVSSVVNTVNSFLQSSLDIAPGASKFDAIYEAVASEDSATIFVFRRYIDDSSDVVELVVGFISEASVADEAELTTNDFDNPAGPIFRVVLTASSVTPEDWLESTSRNGDNIFTLETADPAEYPEGYFAMEVRIFAEDPPSPGTTLQGLTKDTGDLADEEPVFTYNTAVVR